MVCGIAASIRFSAAYLLLISWFPQENESTIVGVVGFQSPAKGTGSPAVARRSFSLVFVVRALGNANGGRETSKCFDFECV